MPEPFFKVRLGPSSCVCVKQGPGSDPHEMWFRQLDVPLQVNQLENPEFKRAGTSSVSSGGLSPTYAESLRQPSLLSAEAKSAEVNNLAIVDVEEARAAEKEKIIRPSTALTDSTRSVAPQTDHRLKVTLRRSKTVSEGLANFYLNIDLGENETGDRQRRRITTFTPSAATEKKNNLASDIRKAVSEGLDRLHIFGDVHEVFRSGSCMVLQVALTEWESAGLDLNAVRDELGVRQSLFWSCLGHGFCIHDLLQHHVPETLAGDLAAAAVVRKLRDTQALKDMITTPNVTGTACCEVDEMRSFLSLQQKQKQDEEKGENKPSLQQKQKQVEEKGEKKPSLYVNVLITREGSTAPADRTLAGGVKDSGLRFIQRLAANVLNTETTTPVNMKELLNSKVYSLGYGAEVTEVFRRGAMTVFRIRIYFATIAQFNFKRLNDRERQFEENRVSCLTALAKICGKGKTVQKRVQMSMGPKAVSRLCEQLDSVDWDRERGEKEGVPPGVKISLKACDEAQQSAYFFDMLDTLNES